MDSNKLHSKARIVGYMDFVCSIVWLLATVASIGLVDLASIPLHVDNTVGKTFDPVRIIKVAVVTSAISTILNLFAIFNLIQTTRRETDKTDVLKTAKFWRNVSIISTVIFVLVNSWLGSSVDLVVISRIIPGMLPFILAFVFFVAISLSIRVIFLHILRDVIEELDGGIAVGPSGPRKSN